MSVIKDAMAWLSSSEKRSSLENPAVPLTFPVELMMDGLFGPVTDAGVRVSELTAMSQPTVHACVRVISETLGQAPLHLFEEQNEGLALATDSPIYDIIHDRPNPWMDSHVFRESMQACVLLWGNAYAVIERDNAGRPIALWPRNPAKTHPVITMQGTGQQKLMYTSSDGNKDGQFDFWDATDMIHIRGLGLDGLIGLSPIKYYMKSAIGLAMAQEAYGARFFANNGRPGGILIYNGNLSPDVKEQIRRSWQEAQAGNNQGRPAVLTGSWDWKEINVPPNEAQFLESRKLQQEVVCGMFRVPPHMVGILERSTNNNIEQQSLEFVRNCMMPWFVKWQSEFKTKLCPRPAAGRNASKRFHVRFDTSELTQGDFKTTMEALSVGLLNGTYSINEARKKLGLNPIEDGDVHTVQAQLVNIASIAEPGEAPATPAEPVTTPALGQEEPSAEEEPQQSSLTLGNEHRTGFTEAFSRLLARDKRERRDISQLFEQVINGLAHALEDQAVAELRGQKLAAVAFSTILEDSLSLLAKRAGNFKAEQADSELDRLVRSLRVALFREVAVSKAKENHE